MDQGLAVLALKALDGLSMRADVTAQNIANSNTNGYRPLRVSFETALADAACDSVSAVQHVEPRIEHAAPIGGSADMRLDLELQTASSTAMRYGAIIDVLSREMQLASLAVAQGR